MLSAYWWQRLVTGIVTPLNQGSLLTISVRYRYALTVDALQAKERMKVVFALILMTMSSTATNASTLEFMSERMTFWSCGIKSSAREFE